MPKWSKECGFSLLELVFGIAIGFVVVATASTLIVRQSRNQFAYSSASSVSEAKKRFQEYIYNPAIVNRSIMAPANVDLRKWVTPYPGELQPPIDAAGDVIAAEDGIKRPLRLYKENGAHLTFSRVCFDIHGKDLSRFSSDGVTPMPSNLRRPNTWDDSSCYVRFYAYWLATRNRGYQLGVDVQYNPEFQDERKKSIEVLGSNFTHSSVLTQKRLPMECIETHTPEPNKTAPCAYNYGSGRPITCERETQYVPGFPNVKMVEDLHVTSEVQCTPSHPYMVSIHLVPGCGYGDPSTSIKGLDPTGSFNIGECSMVVGAANAPQCPTPSSDTSLIDCVATCCKGPAE